MTLDAHVHTRYAGRTSLYPLSLIMRAFLAIERRRPDASAPLPYLRKEGIFTSFNHVASRVNGPVGARHVAALVPWIDASDTRNGSRLARPSVRRRAVSVGPPRLLAPEGMSA